MTFPLMLQLDMGGPQVETVSTIAGREGQHDFPPDATAGHGWSPDRNSQYYSWEGGPT